MAPIKLALIGFLGCLCAVVFAATITITWTYGVKQSRSVAKGDTVVFKWTSSEPHDVWQFPNKSAFDNCAFGSATKKCGTGVTQCAIKMGTLGTRYYGCKVGTHCKNGGMKIAIKTT
jgi:hypothetical protein